jgi:hypothetical protein
MLHPHTLSLVNLSPRAQELENSRNERRKPQHIVVEGLGTTTYGTRKYARRAEPRVTAAQTPAYLNPFRHFFWPVVMVLPGSVV